MGTFPFDAGTKRVTGPVINQYEQDLIDTGESLIRQFDHFEASVAKLDETDIDQHSEQPGEVLVLNRPIEELGIDDADARLHLGPVRRDLEGQLFSAKATADGLTVSSANTLYRLTQKGAFHTYKMEFGPRSVMAEFNDENGTITVVEIDSQDPAIKRRPPAVSSPASMAILQSRF